MTIPTENLVNFNNDYITIVQSFDTMRRFLEDYWIRGGKASDDIAMLLSSLDRDEANNTYPVDRALWDDWISSVNGQIIKLN